MGLGLIIRNARMYIRSKGLFRGWYSSAIDYFLARAGLRDCVRVRCGSHEACVAPVLYRSAVWAYYNGFIRGVDCGGNAIAMNGTWLSIDEYTNVNVGGLALRFKSFKPTFLEVFVLRDYDAVNYRNRAVVDVGAFVGDSAIYFALKGARKVYAIEPDKDAFSELLMNIVLNNVGDRVIPINVAVGGSGMSLAKLIEYYGIETDVLKMDCEGCEYDVMLNPSEPVSEFNEVIIELHKRVGNHNRVKDVLRASFNCGVVRSNDDVEILHCVKVK